jgi:hypothetical protein
VTQNTARGLNFEDLNLTHTPPRTTFRVRIESTDRGAYFEPAHFLDWSIRRRERTAAAMSQKNPKNAPGGGKGAPKGKKGAAAGKKAEEEREETLQAVV